MKSLEDCTEWQTDIGLQVMTGSVFKKVAQLFDETVRKNLPLIKEWPTDILVVITALATIILTLLAVQFISDSLKNSKTADAQLVNKDRSKGRNESMTSFRLFQAQYLLVYLTIMLADWLQGTNMYTLYKSYNVDVGTLFLTGFLSSALFGTFVGIYVDKWGRKLGCIVFCLLEIVINILEHVPSMPVLMAGRVLGGVSTSLLFSTFESWMVSEHRKRGFSEELLLSTFTFSSCGNGIVAIVAGFLAQVACDVRGDIGPFQLAIALSVVSMLVIFSWRENYGNSGEVGDVSTVSSQIASSTKLILKSPAMLYLGLGQAFFEGAVYTFVFMWVPSMMKAYGAHNNALPNASLPLGLIFSCFMLSMTIGGQIFGLIFPLFPGGGAEYITIFVYIAAAVSMTVPIISFDFWHIFIAFLVLEAMVGMFNSCGATLRSRIYPEGMQSSIMSVFRLPLNLLVVLGTKLTDNANDISSLQFVFGVTASMHIVAIIMQILLQINLSTTSSSADSKMAKKAAGPRVTPSKNGAAKSAPSRSPTPSRRTPSRKAKTSHNQTVEAPSSASKSKRK